MWHGLRALVVFWSSFLPWESTRKSGGSGSWESWPFLFVAFFALSSTGVKHWPIAKNCGKRRTNKGRHFGNACHGGAGIVCLYNRLMLNVLLLLGNNSVRD